jgi:hypothetical protein
LIRLREPLDEWAALLLVEAPGMIAPIGTP